MASAGLRKWLAEQPSSNLQCRDTGHQWQHSTVARVPGGFARTLVCKSCPTTKVQTLDSKGFIVKTKSSYDKTYLRPSGFGRITATEKAVLRLHNIKEN